MRQGFGRHHEPLFAARLQKPLKRIGPRGSGEFAEIEWDEALATATDWLGAIRKTDPRRLAFFTGRDQSPGPDRLLGEPVRHAQLRRHGGFCSVNMAAAGLYTIGGSFWEFGEPDWEHTRYLLMFRRRRGPRFQPAQDRPRQAEDRRQRQVRLGQSGAHRLFGDRRRMDRYPAGSDGLLVLALIHELLAARKVDLDYLVRYTNAPWLVRREPGGRATACSRATTRTAARLG